MFRLPRRRLYCSRFGPRVFLIRSVYPQTICSVAVFPVAYLFLFRIALDFYWIRNSWKYLPVTRSHDDIANDNLAFSVTISIRLG
ncbi:unnamed protein product, partial [Iphiclides podalirius]